MFADRTRAPLAVLAFVAGASWAVVVAATGAEPHWAGHVLGALLLAVGVGWAERRLGTRRTAVIAAVGTVVPTVATVLLLALGDAVDEAFAELASEDVVWAPSVTLVAVVVAASRGLAPSRRRGVRAAVLAVVVAGVLFGGYATDAARAAALLAGLGLGRRLVPVSPLAAWHDQAAHRARTVAATALGTLALGWSVAAVDPHASGPFMTLGHVLPPAQTVAAVGVLVLAVALLLHGRRLGLVLAVAALLLMTGMLVWFVGTAGVPFGPYDGDDLPPPPPEWEVAVLLTWLAPAASLVVVVTRRHAFARRPRGALGTADRDRLLARMTRGDAGSLAWMGTWAGNCHWFADDEEAAVADAVPAAPCEGVVAYRPAHGVALTVSDPVSTGPEAAETIRRFARWCSARALVPAFYSVHGRHLDTFAEMGWHVTPVAEEAVLDLAGFSTSGKKRQDLRTAVNRAARDGVEAVWGTWADLPAGLRAQVEALSDDWVDAKALPEMGFTLGGLAELDDPDVLVLLAVDEAGRLHGVTSWLPSWRDGELVGRTLDVMRRGVDPMPGVVEFLVATAARTFQAEGLEQLSLSGTPLAPLRSEPPRTAATRVVMRVTEVVRHVLEPSYGFTSLARFKAKFDPRYETLWLACPSAADLAPIGRALAAAYVPGLRAHQVVGALRVARRSSRGQVRDTARP